MQRLAARQGHRRRSPGSSKPRQADRAASATASSCGGGSSSDSEAASAPQAAGCGLTDPPMPSIDAGAADPPRQQGEGSGAARTLASSLQGGIMAGLGRQLPGAQAAVARAQAVGGTTRLSTAAGSLREALAAAASEATACRGVRLAADDGGAGPDAEDPPAGRGSSAAARLETLLRLTAERVDSLTEMPHSQSLQVWRQHALCVQ